jgi:hypothetical protein
VTAAIERAIARGVTVSVYLDDIVGSHNGQDLLRTRAQCDNEGMQITR